MHVVAAETEFGVLLNVGTLLGLVMTVASGVWKFSRIEKAIEEKGQERNEELRTEMEAKFDNTARDLLQLERDNVVRTETLRHETGEVGAALRTKIHEMEVFNRDTFVSTKNFDQWANKIEVSIDKLGARLEAKIDRLGRRD